MVRVQLKADLLRPIVEYECDLKRRERMHSMRGRLDDGIVKAAHVGQWIPLCRMCCGFGVSPERYNKRRGLNLPSNLWGWAVLIEFDQTTYLSLLAAKGQRQRGRPRRP